MLDLHPVLTHAAAFLAGAVTWCLVTLRGGHAFLGKTTEGSTMSDTTTPAAHAEATHRRRSVPVVLTIVLVASALLVGFGIQQATYQREARDRDACYQAWGDDLVETVRARTGQAGRVEAARIDRDDAVDVIIGVVIGLRDRPPTAVERDLDRALAEFTRTKRVLVAETERAAVLREENPYPALNCD